MLTPPRPKQSHGVRLVGSVLIGALAIAALLVYALVRALER